MTHELHLSYIQLKQICKQRCDNLCLQIFYLTTKYRKIKDKCVYIVGIDSLKKLFEQVEQIPLTITYGHDIIKTQRERDCEGNQLKQIEKNKKSC